MGIAAPKISVMMPQAQRTATGAIIFDLCTIGVFDDKVGVFWENNSRRRIKCFAGTTFYTETWFQTDEFRCFEILL